MEIKIGVQFSARELVLESSKSAAEIEAAVAAAQSGGVLALTDDKGRTVLVPGDKLAYVEITDTEPRRVGFGG